MTFPKMDRELLDELLNITDAFLLKGAEYKIKYYTKYVFDYNKADTPEECYRLQKSGYETISVWLIKLSVIRQLRPTTASII